MFSLQTNFMCDTTQFGKSHTSAVSSSYHPLPIQSLTVGQHHEIVKDADGVWQHQMWL